MAGRTVTDPRSELGFRTDKSYALPGAVLTLRGRQAWMHDYNPDQSVGATFTALPGAFFVVNGAAQPRDAWLSMAAAEVKFMTGWSLAASLDSQWAPHATSYAGKDSVRYRW
ncbi:autotransporter domain-containing protein [Bradyrhizobium betae]